MIRDKILFFIFFLFIISGCSTFPINKFLGIQDIAEPGSKDSSAVAITIDQEFGDGFFDRYKLKIEKVFIIQLKDESDTLKQRKIFCTNYYNAPFMAGFQADANDSFLLNIEPGFYAAVGAVAHRAIIYFPEDVIKSSIVEVKPNQMIYMGEYKLRRVSHYAKYFPDESQQYYYTNQLFVNYKDNKGNMLFDEGRMPSHHAPTAEKLMRSKEIEIKFLKDYFSTFEMTGWDKKIKSRLNNLK